MLTNEVELISTEIIPKDVCVHGTTSQVDLDVDTSYIVTASKREYAIVGDAYFATVSAGETPAWMVDLINETINTSLDSALLNVNTLKTSILKALRELDVAKNQYEELINIDVTIDAIISSRLATLNASLANTNAQIIELDTTKVTASEAIAISLDQISSELNSPSGTLYGAITDIHTTVTNLNGGLDAKYAELYNITDNMGYVLALEIERVEASIETVAEAVIESMDLALVTQLLAVAERTEQLSASLSNGPMKWVGKFDPSLASPGFTTTVTVQTPAGSYVDRAGNTGAAKITSGSYITPTPAPATVSVVVAAATGVVTFTFSAPVVLADSVSLITANPGMTNVLATGNPAIWTASVPALPVPASGTKYLKVVVPTGVFRTIATLTAPDAAVLGTTGFGSIVRPETAPSSKVTVDNQTGSVTVRFSEAPCNSSGVPLNDAQVAALVVVTGATKTVLGKQGNTYKWLVASSATTITASVAAGSYYGRTGVAGLGNTFSTGVTLPLSPDVLVTLSASGQGLLQFSATPVIDTGLITILGGSTPSFTPSGSTVTFTVTPDKATGSGVTINIPTAAYTIGAVAGKGTQLYAFVDPIVPTVDMVVNVAAGEVVFSFSKPLQSFNVVSVLAANPFLTALVPTEQTASTGPYAAAERQVRVYSDQLEAVGTALQTITATLNGKIATVEVDMGAFVTELGVVGSRYGVKLTAGGINPSGGATPLVGGFELLNDGTLVSAGFDVDEFWVGRTAVTGKKPFRIVSGVVYIDSAVIQNASIDFAKITDSIQSDTWAAGVDPNRWRIGKNGVAEFQNVKARGDIEAQSLKAGTAMVDTLHVNGNAITIAYYAYTAPGYTLTAGSSSSGHAPISATMPSGSTGAMFIASLAIGSIGVNTDSQVDITILKDGSVIGGNSYSVSNSDTYSLVVTAFDPTPTGTHTYTITVSVASGGDSVKFWNASLMCIGAKR